MKKSLIFLIMAAFLASVAFGAPAKNATTGGGNKASSAKKAKAKTPSKKPKARKSVDEPEETRGKQGQLGLMPSELDKANHNVYYADADAIRGARDTESALRYIPFVTITNTAGFGQAFDFRSQGRVSANGVKFFINGIAANPLDNYYGFMPINSVLPNLIQEIKVYPGSGAVLYGSGAKGAVLDIITSKRQKPYYLVGAGYVNTTGGDNSYYGVAQAAEKFGAVRLNAGLGYSQKGGPREDDNTQSIQAVLGGDYELFLGSSIFADVDFYNGKIKSTPYNSFWDTASIEARITAAGDRAKQEAQKKDIALATKPIDPEQTNRSTKGDGEIQSKQTRLTASLGYTSEVTRDLKWELLGFFALDNRKYDIYTARIPFYQYGDKTFTGTGEKSNIADQSGSQFNEMKFGGKFKANLTHNNGEFLFGIDSYYEKAKRNAKQNLQSASIDPDIMYSGILVNIDNTLNLSKWTNALYGVERYDFNDFFSIAGGLRYEMTKYRSESDDYVYARDKNINADGSEQAYKETKDPAIPSKSLKQDTGNFVFELAPAFRYSDTGVVYARYERGYTTLPPYAMSDRKGSININSASQNAFSHDFTYEDTNLKDETYNTYELGWKEFIGKESLYFADGLFFSLNGFYTESKNEFYFSGDPYVGVKYGTYDKSRRYGGEAAFEQYFLDGVIGFNESFTYVKAQYQDTNGEWKQIPYTYDYKATFGAALNITAMVEIIDVNLGVWLQNSFYGKQKVSYSEIDPITKGVVSDDEKKLAPYLVSDLGISVGFNKNMGVITVGIKNVFDTFYYDYYNHDLNSAIGEYRYLIGQGRTVFLEGQFKY